MSSAYPKNTDNSTHEDIPPLPDGELFWSDDELAAMGVKPAPVCDDQLPMPEEPTTYDEPAGVCSPDITAPFLILGFDHGNYYFRPEDSRQVVSLRADQLTRKGCLLQLAPLSFWERHFEGRSGGFSTNTGADWLIRRCHQSGIYDPSRIRGRGAWEDDGRSVLHVGPHLIVNARKTTIEDFETGHIYEAAAPLETGMDAAPIGTAEANRLAELCSMLCWDTPISGRHLAGWIALAPICGALSWRPHIQITGPSGSGKSWVMDNILRPAVGPCAVLVQSNTTEAGLRQLLKYDARPVLFDEAEGENKAGQARMQKVIELARQASSANGAAIVKGSSTGAAQSFKINSMFALSAIGAAATQRADLSRITTLSLVINNSFDRAEQFRLIQKTAHDLAAPGYYAGLRARTVRLIPVVRRNAEVFARAVAGHLGTARAGDQYGTLLAGAYSLYSAGEIDEKTAVKWVSEQDWGEAVETGTDTDEQKCISVILEFVIRIDAGRGSEDLSVGETVHAVAFGAGSDSRVDALAAALGRHGLKVDVNDDLLIVSNTHTALGRILRDTPWGVNWGQILARLPGAERLNKTVRFAGTTSKAVSVPISVIFPKENDLSY